MLFRRAGRLPLATVVDKYENLLLSISRVARELERAHHDSRSTQERLEADLRQLEEMFSAADAAHDQQLAEDEFERHRLHQRIHQAEIRREAEAAAAARHIEVLDAGHAAVHRTR